VAEEGDRPIRSGGRRMAPGISRREVASTCAGWGSLLATTPTVLVPCVPELGVPLRHCHFYRGGREGSPCHAGTPSPTAVRCGSTGRDSGRARLRRPCRLADADWAQRGRQCDRVFNVRATSIIKLSCLAIKQAIRVKLYNKRLLFVFKKIFFLIFSHNTCFLSSLIPMFSCQPDTCIGVSLVWL